MTDYNFYVASIAKKMGPYTTAQNINQGVYSRNWKADRKWEFWEIQENLSVHKTAMMNGVERQQWLIVISVLVVTRAWTSKRVKIVPEPAEAVLLLTIVAFALAAAQTIPPTMIWTVTAPALVTPSPTIAIFVSVAIPACP